MATLDGLIRLLAYLAGLLAVAPAYLYLDLPVQLLFPVGLLLGLLGDRRGRELLPNALATLLGVAGFVIYLLQVGRDNLALPVANLLVLLLALRLAGGKSPRYVLQIFILALFTLAASSLLTLSIAYLVYLVLLVGLVTVGLVLLTCANRGAGPELSRRQLHSLVRWALLLPAGSLLLMVVFFLILPRTQYPLWNFLNPKGQARTGLSDTVRPGSVAALAADTSVAFRAELTPLPQDQLYWRAVVLDHIAGSSWRQGKERPEDRPLAGATRQATLFLEPRSDRYLPVLESTLDISGLRERRDAVYTFRARYPLDRRSRYRIEFRPAGALRLVSVGGRERYLQLPARVDPRVAAEATRLAAGGADTATILARTEQFFRDRQLSYAASGLPPTATPVATFLFETRRGYCEYFASSFALLLRLAGVPARLVGGYLGGDYNAVGSYYLVSEEMAHVWVEALGDDGVWQRIDPSRLAVNAATAVIGARQHRIPWYATLLDSIDHTWNRTVINLDLQTQLQLYREARTSLQRWRRGGWPRPAWWWLLPLAAATLPVGVWLWRGRPSAEARLAGRFTAIARCCGPARDPAPGDGLASLARRIGHPLAERFAEQYGRHLYGGAPLDAAGRAELWALLRRLQREQKKRQRNSMR